MIIVKEWNGRFGVNARFYKIGNRFFLDYRGCKETSEIYVTNNNGVVSVRPQVYDVPPKYITSIMRLLQGQVRQPVASVGKPKPKKSSAKSTKATKRVKKK